MGYPFRRKYLLTNTVVQPVQWDEMGLFFTAHWFCLKKGHHQLQGWSSIFFHVVFGYNSFWDKPRLWETSLGRFKIGVFFFSFLKKMCVYIYNMYNILFQCLSPDPVILALGQAFQEQPRTRWRRPVSKERVSFKSLDLQIPYFLAQIQCKVIFWLPKW